MTQSCAACRDHPKLQALVAQIDWFHNSIISQYREGPHERESCQIVRRLPRELKSHLPSPETIAKLLDEKA